MAIPRNLANIAPHVNASSTEVVVNDGGANLDFRVEGDTDANLLFVDAGAEAVGIGSTVEANSKLTVKGAGIAISRDSSSVNHTTAYDIKIRSASPKVGIHATSSSQDLTLEFSGGGSANAIIDVTSSDGLVFKTTGTERARIPSSGNLLVGTTTGTSSAFINTNSSSSKYGWSDRGTSATGSPAGFFNASSVFVGGIGTSTTATTYSTSSDYRLKENVAPMTGALKKVLNLKPCTYTWKMDGSFGEGFIAHELQEIYPQAVIGEKDGEEMQGIDYGKITPLLTAALQEAIAEIKSLKDRVAELEAK